MDTSQEIIQPRRATFTNGMRENGKPKDIVYLVFTVNSDERNHYYQAIFLMDQVPLGLSSKEHNDYNGHNIRTLKRIEMFQYHGNITSFTNLELSN